jgi:hypothetical protein
MGFKKKLIMLIQLQMLCATKSVLMLTAQLSLSYPKFFCHTVTFRVFTLYIQHKVRWMKIIKYQFWKVAASEDSEG